MNLRFEKILQHPVFCNIISCINEKEKTRFFCKHDFEHIISVARIGYIIALEEKINISKDIIYATALLHDIGRLEEYQNNIPHDQAGAEIARSVLEDCGYNENEISEITGAILYHRDNCPENSDKLYEIIYKADKLSRTCFLCDAYEECNWNESQKNKTIIY